MSWRISKAVVIGGVLLLIGIGCGQELFPTCKDPKHPCPDVDPNYPDPTPFGASRDAGTD